MNCKHIRVRTQNQKKYFYCYKCKEKIMLIQCNTCKEKEYKAVKKLKHKTKADKRYSILAEDLTKCVECGKIGANKHEVFYGKNRQMSIRFGLVIPLCSKHHVGSIDGIHFNILLNKKWRKEAQTKFTKVYPELDFAEYFGKNYLEKEEYENNNNF